MLQHLCTHPAHSLCSFAGAAASCQPSHREAAARCPSHILVLALHHPPGLEPAASVFSLGFSAQDEPLALSPIKQLLPVTLWLPLHPTPWLPLCSLLWPPLHHEPWLPLHSMPGEPARPGQGVLLWRDFTQAAALTDSVMPPRVPSLCPAWGCPMGPWPQLSLHSGSSTLGPPPCSEHSC